MKVLVVGAGGREHAIAWKLARSPRVTEVVVAPGNPGMLDVARVVPAGLSVPELVALVERERPGLTVVGPEAPLVDGVVDAIEAAGFAVFGPNRAAARLEGSKAYAKAFMQRHDVPTAAFARFSDLRGALAHLDRVGAPIVIKESGLAAGKGVTVADTLEAARDAVQRCFAKTEGHGTPNEVVIEERLLGQEVSLLVFTDGVSYRPMLLAQDYKQAFDGDEGPMTGGMGAVAPATLLTPEREARVLREVVERTLAGLEKDGVRYRGVLYFGLMVQGDGAKLLEYNVRFGDPETQVVLPLMETDLLDVLEATARGRLEDVELRSTPGAAACVVMAAPGYPGTPRRDVPLAVPADLGPETLVFHAGTDVKDGNLVSAGGRVLNVVSLAPDVQASVAHAYATVDRIAFPGAMVRRDIGGRLKAS